MIAPDLEDVEVHHVGTLVGDIGVLVVVFKVISLAHALRFSSSTCSPSFFKPCKFLIDDYIFTMHSRIHVCTLRTPQLAFLPLAVSL